MEMTLINYMCSFLPHVQERKCINVAQDFSLFKKQRIKPGFHSLSLLLTHTQSDPVVQRTPNLRRVTGSSAEYH